MPNKVMAGAEDRQDSPVSPLLKGRGLVEGLPAAYVCENYRCELPVTEAVGLATLLSGSWSRT